MLVEVEVEVEVLVEVDEGADDVVVVLLVVVVDLFDALGFDALGELEQAERQTAAPTRTAATDRRVMVIGP